MKKPGDDGLPESDAFPGARPPRLTERLIGQDRAEAELLEAYRGGRLAQSWLIAGPEGVGKATLAWRFARFALVHPDPAAAAVAAARDLSVDPGHPAARQLAAHAHPDFALIRRAWNPKSKTFYTETRVDDVREGQGLFRMASAFDGWRIALVDAADDLNRAGANALLKTIEEPPRRAMVLIVAHRPGRLPPTIRSRCRRLALAPLSPEDIEAVVRDQGPPWSETPSDALSAAARRAGGSAREALRLLDPEGEAVGKLIDALLARLPAVDWKTAFRLADMVVGAAGAEAHERLLLRLYDWLADRARTTQDPRRMEAVSELWRSLRENARQADALNIDRRTFVLARLQEIEERARFL